MVTTIKNLMLHNATTMEASNDGGIYEIPEKASLLGIECWTTGGTTHTGTLSFQVSVSGIRWHTVATKAVTAGAALDHQQDLVLQPSKYLRVPFTRTAGLVTEFLNVTVKAKGC